jgi:hypothetical protein
MKNSFKIFLMIGLAVLLLAAGFYVTLANVSQLLAAGKPQWQCRWSSSNLVIQTGKWREKISLQPPLQVTRQAGFWIVHRFGDIIAVTAKSKLRFLWLESPSGRRSNPNGEY